MRTQVGIVGAGPAGLMLSHLLHRAGISSVIVEARSRAYCEARIRAGLIEQWAADMLVETGLGDAHEARERGARRHRSLLQRQAAQHQLPQAGRQARHHLRPAGGGKGPDRQAARRRRADSVRVLATRASTASKAKRRKSGFATTAETKEIDCDFIGGCDGFHGVCRPSIPGQMRSASTTGNIRSAGSAFSPRRRQSPTS